MVMFQELTKDNWTKIQIIFLDTGEIVESTPGTLHRWGMKSERLINQFFANLGESTKCKAF